MIKELHNKLINKQITKEELFKETIDKAKENNEKFNSFITILDKPNFCDKDDLLNGIPYALKDNISTKGILTTAGSNTLKDYVPIYNATCYQKLNDLGAVLIGKTNLDELGMGGTGTTGHTGIVKNNLNPLFIAGGSSAGSAVAVSSSVVSFALGTDTGDSIRKPASYCGIVGYKPTYGMISRYGVLPYASSLDHVGVLTKTVEDAAIVVNRLKGKDHHDMTSWDSEDIDLEKDLNKKLTKTKLFYLSNLINKETICGQKFLALIDTLRNKGYLIDEVIIDDNLLKALNPTYMCLSCAEATSNYANLTGIVFGKREEGKSYEEEIINYRTKGFSSLIKRRFIIGSYVLLKDNQEKYFLNAGRVRRIIVNKFNELFKQYDAYLMPASEDIAPLINKVNEKYSTNNSLEDHLVIANFGGYPSITIPFIKIKDMPIGLNITGGIKKDAHMLNIASNIEAIVGENYEI